MLLVHPHACGELSTYTWGYGTNDYGSSPRMWGTQDISRGVAPYARFIPTHVGNSYATACRGSRTRGSSPRMWGTLRLPRPPRVMGWFIPTHVGNSASISERIEAVLVHPHACGELSSSNNARICLIGSSPRMWGTLHQTIPLILCSWFIPTHVGNSSRSIFCSLMNMVHPHACGELSGCPIIVRVSHGSSPRMWGTQYRVGCLCR